MSGGKTVAVVSESLAGFIRKSLRSLLTQPLFLLALAACIGILISDLAALPWWLWALAATIAGGIACDRPCRSALLAFCLLVFAFTHQTCDTDPLRTRLAAECAPGFGIGGVMTGIVMDEPVPGFEETSMTFPCRIESLVINGEPWLAGGRTVVTTLRGYAQAPRYGQRITVTGELMRPAPPLNPGEFDRSAWMRRRGESAAFISRASVGSLEQGSTGNGKWYIDIALKCRSWMAEAVTRELENAPEAALVIKAMVLGSEERTPEDITDAFRRSGTIHIFSVSGLHVAMFMIIIQSILAPFSLRPRMLVALAVPLMFFYVFISGMRPSAWRAAIMTSALLIGPVFGREGRMLNGLGLAALMLLAVDTQQLYQPGFTLSFAVLLSIAALQPPIALGLMTAAKVLRYPDPFLPPSLWQTGHHIWDWIRRTLVDSIAVSTAATLGSLVLLVPWFRMISPSGILANLVLVFLSGCVLALACASLLAAACQWTTLSVIFNHTNSLLAAASISSAKFFAGLPGASVHVDPARLWRGRVCEVTVLALKQGGGAILVDTPNGRRWLIDTGGLWHWMGTVKPFLIKSAVNDIDGVILTHGDAMHNGALSALREYFKVNTVLSQEDRTLYRGQVLSLDTDVSLRVLFPDKNQTATKADDAGAVLMLDSGGTRILFTADAGFTTERFLLENLPAEELRAEFLVKSRHMEDFSSLPDFLDAVQPAAVIFSNGYFPEGQLVQESWKAMARGKGIDLHDQTETGGVIISITSEGASIRDWLKPAGAKR